jgi:hypothetical protein
VLLLLAAGCCMALMRTIHRLAVMEERMCEGRLWPCWPGWFRAMDGRWPWLCCRAEFLLMLVCVPYSPSFPSAPENLEPTFHFAIDPLVILLVPFSARGVGSIRWRIWWRLCLSLLADTRGTAGDDALVSLGRVVAPCGGLLYGVDANHPPPGCDGRAHV